MLTYSHSTCKTKSTHFGGTLILLRLSRLSIALYQYTEVQKETKSTLK